MIGKKIFKDARLIRLKLKELDTGDRTFALSWPEERGVETLAAEIETSGLVTPVWIQECPEGHGFRLVDGFRRVAAAEKLGLKDLPAELLSGELAPAELFRARLAGQGPRLSAVEASKVLDKLASLFRVGQSTLVKTFLPLLGMGGAVRLLGQCRSLSNLQEQAALYCAETRTGLGEAALLAGFTPEGQLAILAYLRALRPGGNLLKSYLVLLDEIALRRGTAVEKILEDRALRRLLVDQQTARSNGRELMHKRLHELRYPLMKGLEERFESIRRDLGLPSEILLKPPPLFEGGRLKLTFEIADPGDLTNKARLLLDAAQSGKLDELFGCLGAPSTEESNTGGKAG